MDYANFIKIDGCPETPRGFMEDSLKAQDAKAFVQCMLASIADVGTDESSTQKMNNERLHTLKLFLSQTISEIGRLISFTISEEMRETRSADNVFVVITDAQLVEPRGRFTISLSSDGIICQGAQSNFFVRWRQLSHCACVPNSMSTKKEGEELMALLFSDPIKYNNKEIKSFLWNLNKSELKKIAAKSSEPEMEIIGTEHFVVSTLVAKLCEKKVMTPDNQLFQSVTMKRPFLKCYRGIQEGSLYPLQHGLIFLRPLLLIPIESIASLTAGRGGGSSSTRYIDLMVETLDGKQHEFTNIEREELLAIQIYVNEFLEVRKRWQKMSVKNEHGVKCEAGTDATQGNQCEGEEEEDDDDSDDEDFDPDAVDEDASGRDSDDSKYSGGVGGDGHEDSDSDDENEQCPSTHKRVAVPKRKSAAMEAQKTPDQSNEHSDQENSAADPAESSDGKKAKVHE